VVLKHQPNLPDGLQMFLLSKRAPDSSPIPKSVGEFVIKISILDIETK
jgi:hypothetical protein